MTSPPTRRPLPALVFLVALSLLTALVWWRVLNRGDSSSSAATRPSCSPSTHAAPVVTVLPRPSSISVQVLNSTNRNGIAKAAQATLGHDGFSTPVQAINDTLTVALTGVAQVRYNPGQLAAATLVSYYFPGSTLVALSTPAGTNVVVSLGTAYKAVATAAQVQAALTAAHKTLAAAAPPAKSTSHAAIHPSTAHASTAHASPAHPSSTHATTPAAKRSSSASC
jgi:hypothetical protein